jgi:hypothetical protein
MARGCRHLGVVRAAEWAKPIEVIRSASIRERDDVVDFARYGWHKNALFAAQAA